MGCSGSTAAAKDPHCMSDQDLANLELARLVCKKTPKDAIVTGTPYKSFDDCPAEANAGCATNLRRATSSSFGKSSFPLNSKLHASRCVTEERHRRPRRSAVKSCPRLPGVASRPGPSGEDWCEVKARLSCLVEPSPCSPCVSTASEP
eukprot:gnl/MRDRNA2_/MRDRNA2_19522_c0_seq1.p1 gnl/MRDRNA2_/MRDRNA2_19522_c0~~gnl/MRDRNA2_/MRDRNA2_19522_c0_seq1.p1  ORF type:complete len:148 (+),score=13.61 gnl/MRDRNA2_/MRDRNA2_19522_c0_seq1:110-553(+)